MNPGFHLMALDSVASAIFILSVVITSGLLLGSIRIFGMNLGVAGVLFAGLIFGHFKISVNPEVLEFIREFGLILFVYTIGAQVGPGFFASLKRNGLSLNLMAAFVVVLGAVITVFLSHFGGIPLPAALGMFSGATTNTPSLAAGQQALKDIPGITEALIKMPGLGYAVSYPFGIFGIILAMILTRSLFRIIPLQEALALERETKEVAPLETASFKVENKNLDRFFIKDIPALNETGVVISRISHEGVVQVALPDTRIYLNDIVQAVGPRERLEALRVIIGSKSDVDLRAVKSNIAARRVIVTKPEVAGKTIEELDARNRYGVTITRISRAEIEFPATPKIELHFADTLLAVGEESAIKKFASDMGDSPKQLDSPQLIPVFLGIALGVMVGNWPIYLPGMQSPVRLGLAGGPLIVALILSRIGRIGRLIWYMPMSANFMLREFGIALFLACVGLYAGDQFVATLTEGNGLYWMACATLITIVPILLVAVFARLKFKLNYLTICGLLAGSMTDPPALAFANNFASSSAPSVAYATVYPLVMLLRIVLAQAMVLLFMR